MIWLQPPFGMLSFNCSLLRTLCSLLHLLNLETSAWNIPHKLPIKKKRRSLPSVHDPGHKPSPTSISPRNLNTTLDFSCDLLPFAFCWRLALKLGNMSLLAGRRFSLWGCFVPHEFLWESGPIYKERGKPQQISSTAFSQAHPYLCWHRKTYS